MNRNITKIQKPKKEYFPYEIAIVSYKNAEILQNTTLQLLKKYNISSSKITIFVTSISEYAIYKKILHPNLYGTLIVGSEYSTIHNFVSDYYPIGTCIVNCDDSIVNILQTTETNHVLNQYRLESFQSLIDAGFSECCKTGSSFWGICPLVKNTKVSVTTDLKYCSNYLWGCINPGIQEIKLIQGTNDRDDYERIIVYYLKDKKIIRLNNFSCLISNDKIKYTQIKSSDGIYTLKNKYPNFIKILPDTDKSLIHISLKDRSNC